MGVGRCGKGDGLKDDEGASVQQSSQYGAAHLLPLEDGEKRERSAGAGRAGGTERRVGREESRVHVLWQHAQFVSGNAPRREERDVPPGGDPEFIGAEGARQLGGGEGTLAHQPRDEAERPARVRRRAEVAHQARVAVLDRDGAGRLFGRPLMVGNLRRQVGIGLARGELAEKIVRAPRLQQVQLGHVWTEQGDQPQRDLQARTGALALGTTGGAVSDCRLNAPRRRSPRSRSQWGCATPPVGR
jgi:hypothetical protein